MDEAERAAQMDQLVADFAATYPSLAGISQGKGMPTDLQKTINKAEVAGQLPIDDKANLLKDRDGDEMTLLPRTRCEFEMGEKLSKIKAIRGLTPKKDVKISLGAGFNALLVSKCSMDARFTAMDQQTIKVQNDLYRFVRIRNTKIIEGKSAKFRKIYIVPCADHSLSLIVLQPNQATAPAKGKRSTSKTPIAAPKISLSTMHNDVRDALASLKVTTTHDKQKLWLP